MVSVFVHLRPDTVTKPAESMRAAMATAEGDGHVLSHDPTAFQLELEIAKVMGKEDALFFPPGTMGNLINMLVHCEIKGSEVILGDDSHVHIYQNGGISTFRGVHPRTVRNNPQQSCTLRRIAPSRHVTNHMQFRSKVTVPTQPVHQSAQRHSIGLEPDFEYLSKDGEGEVRLLPMTETQLAYVEHIHVV